MKNVGFQLSDYVFELNAEEYLFKARANTCFFVIHKSDLPGDEADMYFIGALFLRHFYSVYDLDRDEVSLGVNTHSHDKVRMYAPGDRPTTKAPSLAEIHIDSMENYASFMQK